jgi:hypothetical protein
LARKVKIARAGSGAAGCGSDDPTSSGNISYKGRIRCRNRTMAAIRLRMHGFVLLGRIFCQTDVPI